MTGNVSILSGLESAAKKGIIAPKLNTSMKEPRTVRTKKR